MKTQTDKTQENRSRSVSNKLPQKQNRGETAYQFVDNRPEAVAQRRLQEMANNSRQVTQLKAFQEMANKSPQVKQAAELQSTAHNYTGQKVIQMIRYVKRSTEKIEEVEDAYELQEGERFLSKLQEAEHVRHQADLARFRELHKAKEKGPILDMALSRDGSSATLSHLNTRYIDRQMRPRGPLMDGVTTRFLTPTAPVVDDEGPGPKKRQISPEQVEKYTTIGEQVISNEQSMKDSHYAFYHAQDPRMRVAQDVYKRVYARYHQKDLPEDFHFLRFPGPEDDEFRKHKNVQSYFVRVQGMGRLTGHFKPL